MCIRDSTTSTEVNYGISCKYATGLSHPETRSFRFGQSMLVEFGGMAVTKTFSDELKSTHKKLDKLSKKYSKFSELPDGVKEREIIRPTRDAFVDFIKESNDTNPSEIIKALHEKALGSYPLYFARGGGHCGLHAIDFQGRLSAKKTATPTTIVSVKKGGGVSNEIDIDFGTYTMNIRLKNKDSSISRGAIATSVTLSDEFWKTYEVELT